MSALASTAAVIEDLVDYDGPQLLLLKTNRNRHMLAVAIQRENMEQPFFACEITDRTYDRYFDQRADLHFAFGRAYGKTYYYFDLSTAEDGVVKLHKMSQSETDDPEYWPEVGFFSRSHTSTFNRETVSVSVRSFKIDGKWAANDFSQFHTKMADLYALFGVLDRLEGANSATELAFVRQTVQQRFWRGGGSYGGFYDKLIDRNKLLQLAPLEVAKIQYASPGEIALSGNKEVLSNIFEILDVFDARWDELHGIYGNIYGTLKKENLLSAGPSATFSNPVIGELVLKAAREFGEKMNVENLDHIFEACDQNVLVFAKVVLSIYRRANDLYAFHAEGRVQRIG